MSYIVGDRAGGERAGDLIAEIGFDFAKPYSRLPADGYEGLMSACDRHGIRIMGHVPIAVGLEAAIARGQGGIAHAAELFYNEEGPERTDTARIERVLRMMADRGVWLQATVVVTERLEGWGSNGTLASPDADWMNPLQKALWHPDSPMRTQGAARPEARKYFDRTFELTCDTVRRARAAGVDILTGTDFPNPYVVEGFSLHEELALLVDHCDFTPAEVLEASTRRAARYHGGAPVNGTVATGAVADLVLLDGDPLADINATRRVDTVLVAGTTLIRRAAIDDGLSRIRAAYDAMPVRTVTVPADNEYVRDNG